MGDSGLFDRHKEVVQYIKLGFLFGELYAAIADFFSESYSFFGCLSSGNLSASNVHIENIRNATFEDYCTGRNSSAEILSKIKSVISSRLDHVLKVEESVRSLRVRNLSSDEQSRCNAIASVMSKDLESSESLSQLLQTITEALDLVKVMGQLKENADESIVSEFRSNLLDAWCAVNQWDDYRSLQILGEWGTRFFHVMRHENNLSEDWLHLVLRQQFAATPKQRRKQHIHDLWKRQHEEEKLSYAQIAKKHKATTGTSVTSSAVAKALKRLDE